MKYERIGRGPGCGTIRGLSPVLCAVVLMLLSVAGVRSALAEVARLKGQTVYVPAYSHIYYGDREQAFLLTVTLSIRNTDPGHPITVTSVDYYDTDGKLLNHHVSEPVTLGPMGSTRYVVKESDRTGGSGANFVVKWKANARVTAPLIETIMISTATQQGLSFTSRGVAIDEIRD